MSTGRTSLFRGFVHTVSLTYERSNAAPKPVPKPRMRAGIHDQNCFDTACGLRVTDRDTDTFVVTAALCRFYEFWDRDDCGVKAGENGRNRKRSTNNKLYMNSFRTDDIREHLRGQQPKNHTVGLAAQEDRSDS